MDNKATIIRPDTEEQEGFAQKVSEFVIKKRVIFLTAAGAVLAVLLAVGIYSLVSNAAAENSSRAMEVVRGKITAWNSEKDEAKRAEIETALLADIDNIVKKWPRSFAAQQGLFTKSGLYAYKKDWAAAEAACLEAVKRLPKSYLAPVALESAAVAAEEQGKTDAALEHYTTITTQYKTDTPGLAHAYFSIGRLNEAKSDWKAALDAYGRLLSDFADSDWAKLAKDRVIYLKAQGHGA